MRSPGGRVRSKRIRAGTGTPVLRGWLAPVVGALVLGLTGCEPGPAAHPDEASIRAFLTHYFETWSRRDMDAYGACFEPEARVLFLDRSGAVVSEGTVDFLHGQKLGHERSPEPMTERPLEMRIQGDARVAQAAVTWVLTKGRREERGADFFTLRRTGDGWKIVSLVFYGE